MSDVKVWSAVTITDKVMQDRPCPDYFVAEGDYDALRDEVARLRRGLENCHMLARRIVTSESAFFKIDSAHHIIRMCEEAGITKDGVLREDARAAQIEEGV